VLLHGELKILVPYQRFFDMNERVFHTLINIIVISTYIRERKGYKTFYFIERGIAEEDARGGAGAQESTLSPAFGRGLHW